MFWACFGFGIRSDLVVMKGDPDAPRGGVTARRYIEILDEYLFTILDYDSIFMQDNASIHTAHAVRDWFIDHGIELVDWPPYSPDLNPIENLWKLLKARIIELHPELETMKDNDSTKAHLIECAQEAWESLAESMLNKLASEMQKRVDAVKNAGGWYTKY
jgi:transposase InsO family protein